MPIDSQNMLQVLQNFAKQCREALTLPKGIKISGNINNIFICGMGGSAIAGDLLECYLANTKIPIFVIRNYELPKFVNEYSVVFVVSYSGNTEETLSAYKSAIERKAKIICITSNGILEKEGTKVIKIPSGLEPRCALGYLFFPMLGVLHNSNIINVENEELNEMLALLKDVNYYEEKAQEIVKTIDNKIPIIYASNLFKPIAFRWKTQINENSKYPAFYNVFSELNHNEIVGYQHMNRKDFIVIMIKDEFDNPRIKKSMEITRDIIERWVDVKEVYTRGKSLLARMFSTIYLGDFVSYYLALRNRVDPTPIEIIQYLKKKLAE